MPVYVNVRQYLTHHDSSLHVARDGSQSPQRSEVHCNGESMTRERVAPAAAESLDDEDRDWVFDYYVVNTDVAMDGGQQYEVLTIGCLDDEGELVYDGVDSDDEVNGMVQDGGLDELDEKEWDYPDEEDEEDEEDETRWQVAPEAAHRMAGKKNLAHDLGGTLSDDDMDHDIYAESMYGDREKYCHSAYMSDSEQSDIEADPEYQEYMMNVGTTAADGTPCMCPLACPQHQDICGPWRK